MDSHFSSRFHCCVVSFGHSWAVPIVYLSIFQKSHRFTRLWRGVSGGLAGIFWSVWRQLVDTLGASFAEINLEVYFIPTSAKKGMSKGSMKSHCTNRDSACVLVILEWSFSLDCLICWNSLSFCINFRLIDWLMDQLIDWWICCRLVSPSLNLFYSLGMDFMVLITFVLLLSFY